MHRAIRIQITVAVTLLAGCGSGSHWVPAIQIIPGSGSVVEEARTVSGFSRVSFATVGSVHIEQGVVESLRIRAEDNLLPYLTTEVRSGVLIMHTASNVDLRETRPIEFFLTVVDMKEFEFSGVGNAELWNMAVNDLSVRSSGVGPVRLVGLDATRLDVTVAGLGNVSVSGQVDDQVVRVGEWGDYEAGSLASFVTTVTLPSRGSATVMVRDRLVATLQGSGSVYYIGSPVIESTVTGSGRLVKIG